MELTRQELGILYWATRREAVWHEDVMAKGNADGWYDAKSKERVAVHLHETEALVARLNQAIKEIDKS